MKKSFKINVKQSVLDDLKNGSARVEVPTSILRLNGLDMALPPKEWEERFYNVQRWTEFNKGGHFDEWEESEVVAEDIRVFFSN